MLHALRRILGAMGWWEKTLLVVLLLLFLGSSGALLRQFYRENTEIVPVRGGTYIEGSVGTIRLLNPWFTITNDVNKDILSLVFSGLQRYNPFTGKIEDDMATLEVSANERVYTLRLREKLFWHDTTEEQLRPVTADDVIFTYRTIQQQGFPNPILQKNFRGVEIEKIDDRTIQFRLEKPYYFFRSNLTLGILPEHLLKDIPPNRLHEALDFHLRPIGSGPYQFRGIVETELSTEVTLERFPQYYGATPFIDRIVFRAFPDYPSLLSDLRNLSGVRHVPRNRQGRPMIPKRYRTFSYTLPQYVALFFDLDQPFLQDRKLRLGLQLATNKEEIIKAINEQVIIDTPLLELAGEEWQYQFQPEAAQGALYDSEWHLPEKVRLQHLLENRERNLTGALVLPQTVVLLQTGAELIFTGSMLQGGGELQVNGILVQPLPGHSGSWIARLPSDGSTGSIILGENSLRLTRSTPPRSVPTSTMPALPSQSDKQQEQGVTTEVIDTYVLTRAADKREFEQLREEQKIVDLYLLRRPEGPMIDDLRLDPSLSTPQGGVLRLRRSDEPYGIRVNERGESLRLRLLTSSSPPTYPTVARIIAEQWRRIGVDVMVEIPEDRKVFEDRVLRRDYDLLVFGQPLLDNLDSYPYWHSSQVQERVEDPKREPSLRLDAQNLSQYRDFRADALLEQIRETHDPKEREHSLELLREVFREDVPAIMLYTPSYVFAIIDDILGIEIGHPSLHSDRLLSLHRWFIKQGREFKAGKSWWSFLPWIITLQ